MGACAVIRQKVHLRSLYSVLLQEVYDLRHRLRVTVDLFDGRYPYVYAGACLRDALKVVEYEPVAHSDVLLMLLVVDHLYIVKPGVYIREYGLEIAVRSLSAGVYRDIHAFPVKRLYQGLYVLRIHCHHLAARQRYAAARLLIEHLILKAYLHELFYGVLLADQHSEVAEAGIDALSALDALIAVDDRLSSVFIRLRHGYGACRADILASAAARALLSIYLKLGLKSLGLGVVAPPAS